jgi:hypothetical protein
MDVEFYSLSDTFYFIISVYIGQKIYLFFRGMQFQDLNNQKIPSSSGLLAFKSQYIKG